jgi:hypothetical protein
MPRANRHSLPGYIWPITHRCHQKEFLLRFARDRQAGLGWLLEAKWKKRCAMSNSAGKPSGARALRWEANNRWETSRGSWA